MVNRTKSAGEPILSIPRPPTNRPGFSVAMRRLSANEDPIIDMARATPSFKRNRSAREKLRPSETQAAIGVEFHSTTNRRGIGPRRHACKSNRIGDQYAAI